MISSSIRTVLVLIATTALATAACSSNAPASLTTPASTSPPTQAVPTPTLATTQILIPSVTSTIGAWSHTGSMGSARAEHTATLLPNGKVLVAGGVADGNEAVALASAELYDPSTGSWTATGSMVTPRARHTATLLKNGKVLVAGGYCPGTTKGCPSVLDPDGAIATAELYDPATGKWTATGSMKTTRFRHTASLLADGKVLVAGAEHGMPDAILAAAEVYDPGTGKWTPTTDMITARTQQFAVLLKDGTVLMVGGIGPVSATAHDVLASAELYDAHSGTWKATGSLNTARAQPATIEVLRDGRVLIAGGDGPGDPMLASAELYDPTTRTWAATKSMNVPRVESAATLLKDGRVFVVGGFSAEGAPLLGSAEVFDSPTATWLDGGDPHPALQCHDNAIDQRPGSRDGWFRRRRCHRVGRAVRPRTQVTVNAEQIARI
jgi:hypothetical protein